MTFSSDDVHTRNDAMHDEVESMLAAVRRQYDELADAQARAAQVVGDARSSDGTVRVVVDVRGTVRLAEVAPDSFRRSSPDALGRAITEAAQAAAEAARQSAARIMAPITAVAADLPDLSDLVPGAPSIRHLAPPPASPAPDDDDEPSYGRDSILKDGW